MRSNASIAFGSTTGLPLGCRFPRGVRPRCRQLLLLSAMLFVDGYGSLNFVSLVYRNVFF
jgi:hypothetical protein